jgi:hypothetical protein
MIMYRYRYQRSLSRYVLDRFIKHRGQLGDIKRVVAKRYGAWRQGTEGQYYTSYEVLMVYGTQGTARFTGCCWGYGGSGPHATLDLLLAIGIAKEVAEQYAFHTPRKQNIGIDWEINLTPTK